MTDLSVIAHFRCLNPACGQAFAGLPGPGSCPYCHGETVAWTNYGALVEAGQLGEDVREMLRVGRAQRNQGEGARTT